MHFSCLSLPIPPLPPSPSIALPQALLVTVVKAPKDQRDHEEREDLRETKVLQIGPCTPVHCTWSRVDLSYIHALSAVHTYIRTYSMLCQ